MINWEYFNGELLSVDTKASLCCGRVPDLAKDSRQRIVMAKYMYSQFLMKIRKPTAELAKFLLCESDKLDFVNTESWELKKLAWEGGELPFEIMRYKDLWNDVPMFHLPSWIENPEEVLLVRRALAHLEEKIKERREMEVALHKDREREEVGMWLSERGYTNESS